MPVHSGFWLALGAGSCVAAIALGRHGIVAGMLLAGSIFSTSLTAAQIEQFAYPVNHISAYTADDEQFAELELAIVQSPRLIVPPPGELRDLPPKQVAQVQVRAVRTLSGWQPACGELVLTVEQINPRLAAGQIVRVTGRLGRPMPPMNPGEFDYAAYCRDQRILVELRVSHPDAVRIIEEHDPSPLVWLREKTRHLLAMGFSAKADYDHAVLAAYVLGDSDPQLRDLMDDFARTGTVHLFSVSGLHVAIVGAIVLLAGRLLRQSPRTSVLTALAIVWLYAAISTPSWPGWRSVIMATVGAVGLLSRRSLDGLQMLAVATAAILLVHPADLRSGGFQVSFVAVLGLILFSTQATRTLWAWWRGPDLVSLAPPRRGPIASAWNWIARFVGSTFLAGLIAWGMAMPLIAYHFGQINWWSVPAGVLLLPLAMLALVAGILKIILSLCWPGGSAFWASMSAAPVLWIQQIVHAIDKIPGSSVSIASPPILLMVLFYVSVALLLIRTERVWLRWIIRFAPAAALVVLILGSISSPFARAADSPSQIRITLLSVGAGQCGIVEYAPHHVVLIDAGSSSISDVMDRLLQPFLRDQHDDHIDKIILSHGDFDHISAAADLFLSYGEPPVVISPQFQRHAAGNLPDEALLQTIQEAGQAPQIIHRGHHVDLARDVGLDVLWPPVNCDMNSNNCGLVLKLHYGGRTVLFPADIQEPPERELLRNPAQLHADVLVAPHHGSAETTTADFIHAVAPEMILASNDRKLSHKQKTFDILAHGMALYRTHRYGAITLTIHSDGTMSLETYVAGPNPTATK